MANYCSTVITIKHEDTLLIENLYSLILEWMKEELNRSDDYDRWVGRIAISSGIDTSDINMDGSITYMEIHGNQIDIGITSKGAPVLLLFQRVLDEYLDDAKLIYLCDMCDDELFTTNNPDVVGTYHVEIYDDLYEELDMDDEEALELEEMADWSVSEETLIKILQRILGTRKKKLDSLLEMLEDSDFCDYVEINEWEYQAPEDWC